MIDRLHGFDPIRVVVVDDEELSRQHVLALLAPETDVQVVGEFESGVEALASMTAPAGRPELAFLDVRMPDLDGLELLEALGADERPEIVFVTGYDRYMERAFEVHAVDYLRKPFTPARFASALDAARQRVHGRRLAAQASGAERTGPKPPRREEPAAFDAMLESVRGHRSDSRLAIRDRLRGKWDFVPKDTIDWIEADGDTQVKVRAGTASYVWRKTLAEVERLLDPTTFLRVHRSYIVNGRRVRQAKSLQKGEYALFFPDDGIVDTGRSYRKVVEDFLNAR
jgi:two-component system LytT family response regulator